MGDCCPNLTMDKITITEIKSEPVDGVFTVTLSSWYEGEQFNMPVPDQTTETWNEDTARQKYSEFRWNIRSQFE
jgi:hypothetical protein